LREDEMSMPIRALKLLPLALGTAATWAAIATVANADHFSYRDDRECADTPKAETAIAACTRLYESGTLGPSNRAIALGNRGAAAKFLGRYERAMADFTLAMGLDPRNPRYFCQRGDVLRRRGVLRDAIADYNAALTRAPGSICAFQGRAQAYLAQGNTQQALADIAQALRSKPGSFKLLVLRGRANNQAKLYEAAVADFSQALASKLQTSLRPGDRATIYSQRALALLKLNRSTDARADVDEALRIEPQNAPAIAAMASLEEQSGRMNEAIAFYSRALAIKPDLEEAKRGLERLTLPKVDLLPTSPAPALEVMKDTRRLQRVTVPKAVVRPATAATPDPTLETSKDAKPGVERLALPSAIPPLDAQLADNNFSYKHSWARFWFLLGGVCWVAMLYVLVGNLMKGPAKAPEMSNLSSLIAGRPLKEADAIGRSDAGPPPSDYGRPPPGAESYDDGAPPPQDEPPNGNAPRDDDDGTSPPGPGGQPPSRH
jgi:tetratricopeptide (TPR) repeat protein